LTEFEHDVPKVTAISDKVVMLMAGDAVRGSRLVRELRRGIPAGPSTVEQIASVAALMYAQHRQQQLETELFIPRGITMQQYYGSMQQMLPQLVGAIDQYMVGFNYGAEFLLAGVDDGGAHLFVLGNPGGSASDLEMVGFHAIGSGFLHALQSMIGFAHTPHRTVHETVFAVYASKRRAEVAPGVGKETDLLIIQPNGMVHLAGPALAQLETLYQQTQQPVSAEIRQQVEALDLGDGG
jgi:20S proteasome alpha/beta subunit